MSITETVPTKAMQRARYHRWRASHGEYYQPTPGQEDLMFACVEERDLCIFDRCPKSRTDRSSAGSQGCISEY